MKTKPVSDYYCATKGESKIFFEKGELWFLKGLIKSGYAISALTEKEYFKEVSQENVKAQDKKETKKKS